MARMVPRLAIVLTLAFAGCRSDVERSAMTMTGGDPARGRAAILRYGCESCHRIPGLGPGGLVGPPLTHLANRVYLAGRLPNTPENLIAWIMHPQKVEPGNAMPEMGVTREEARDIAAYLYTLR